MIRSITMVFFLLSLTACSQSADHKLALVHLNNRVLELQVADTQETIKKGLMGVQGLCKDCGMVFNWHKTRFVSFWMKNTNIPLDIAFIDENLMITEILPLEPQNEDSIKSRSQVRYAIEMNQGWFTSNDVQVGDRVTIEIF